MLNRKLYIITYLFLISLNFTYSQDLETIMQSGNEYFQNKEYQDAVNSYESIIKQGYLGGELFYNLGNAYFRLGNIGKAILYYEKSLKIAPGNDDTINNLKIANARTVDKTQQIPSLFIVKWWNILLTTLTSTGWQIVIFVFYLFLLICIALYLLVSNLRIQKFSFIFGVLNAGVLVISMILFFSSLSRESSNNNGILLQSTVSAKISPDSKSNDAFLIHEGIKFAIEEKVNNWVKIKLTDGKVGWIQLNSFEII